MEDTALTTEDIGREFNPEIAKLVDGVTKLKNYDFKTREEQQWESLRKIDVYKRQRIPGWLQRVGRIKPGGYDDGDYGGQSASAALCLPPL